jgi:hypothetical protein
MAKFHRWPLFDKLVLKYFEEGTGWRNVTEWDSEDIVALELFANAELQRRAAAGVRVNGNTTVH